MKRSFRSLSPILLSHWIAKGQLKSNIVREDMVVGVECGFVSLM
jgi:hypothetical protein